MPDPVIVPPVPTVLQGEKIVPTDSPENRAATENILGIFDRVTPEKFKSPKQTPDPAAKVVSQPDQRTLAEQVQPAQSVTAQEPQQKPSEHLLPSFLEQALGTEPVKPALPAEAPSVAPAALPGEWPEEMPAVATGEEQKANYRKWRTEYNQLKTELAAARAQPGQPDEATTRKVTFLEGENRSMREQLSRMGVEQHRDFQAQIINPMKAAWGEASRILSSVGGKPEELAKALNLSGKAQFEAIDEILEDVPQSARMEITGAVGAYRRLDQRRRAALDQRNLPQTVEALRKKDMEVQLNFLARQKEQMGSMYDQAVARLRDEAKVEVLQRSNDPNDKWWNDQAEQLEAVGRGVFTDNTDMGRLAYACAMAPMADVYRKLFLSERTARLKAEGCGRQIGCSSGIERRSRSPTPKWNGSPLARTVTGRPRYFSISGIASPIGLGQARRRPRISLSAKPR